MAYVSLIPLTGLSLNVGGSQPLTSTRFGPVKTPGGTPIDLSTWDHIQVQAYNAGLDVKQNVIGNTFTIATGSITKNADGTMDLKYDATNIFTGTLPGRFPMLIFGGAVSGDPDQLVGSGTCVVTF